jgi:YD repeat-containing protein
MSRLLPLGRINWEYDILDRVVKETTSQGTVAYDYDTKGTRTTLDAPNGYSVSPPRLGKLSR